MRKLMAGVLAMAMVLSAGAVWADTQVTDKTMGDKKGTFQVTLDVTETYTVQIPDTTRALGAKNSKVDAGTITASNVLLNTSKELNVKVTSENNWFVKSTEASAQVAYELYYGSEVYSSLESTATTDTAVLTVASGTTTGTANLAVALTGDPTKAASDYADTLTFTVSVDRAD